MIDFSDNARVGSLVAGQYSDQGDAHQVATNPATTDQLPGRFVNATTEDVDQAVAKAQEAFSAFAKTTPAKRAALLRAIADNIEALGDSLVERAMAESGLPQGRIVGERGRTCGQLRKFADHVEEGSYVNAIIDEAQPDRQPMPRADIRKCEMPLGPVVVFTASNFPLAFSTAGGDTSSALAAGCPVVVKAHPSHLGTNALVADAISRAVIANGLPAGTFSSVQGSLSVGQHLVSHPDIKAVGFTGSLRGGRALFDLANSRPDPIPVYAEMGSINPIFLLSEKLAEDPSTLAQTVANSVNLGAGQFCTNPGLIVYRQNEDSERFVAALRDAFVALPASTMLNEGIYRAYNKGKATCTATAAVTTEASASDNGEGWRGVASVASVSARDFLRSEQLQDEVFGPFTLLVSCNSDEELSQVANAIHGQLTASIYGTDGDLSDAGALVQALSDRVGRVIFNGVPTGVEVCQAMHHGGPYPAATFAKFTSVGTDAIQRFVRPVSFQNAPDHLLPDALKPGNPLGIWRIVNGQHTQS